MKREASAQKVQGVDDESQAKLKDEETAGFTLFGEEQEVQCAYEPSNIIWENLEIPVKTRNRNKCRVLLIICFMLLIILLAVASSPSAVNSGHRRARFSALCTSPTVPPPPTAPGSSSKEDPEDPVESSSSLSAGPVMQALVLFGILQKLT